MIFFMIYTELPPYADTADLTKELGWVPRAIERKLLLDLPLGPTTASLDYSFKRFYFYMITHGDLLYRKDNFLFLTDAHLGCASFFNLLYFKFYSG